MNKKQKKAITLTQLGAFFALVTALSGWTSTAIAASTVLVDNAYNAADLDALWVGSGRSHTLSSGGLNIGAGGQTRTIMMEDGIGSVSGFDSVEFEFTMNVERTSGDKDLLIGIHDGSRHLSLFGLDASNNSYGSVFGDALAIGDGSIGIGLSNGGPISPTTVRDSIGGSSTNNYNFKIVMDATGLTTLEIPSEGFVSSAMLLDNSQNFSFYIGSDQAGESYRILDSSILVTGFSSTVAEPSMLILLSSGFVAVLLVRRKSRV